VNRTETELVAVTAEPIPADLLRGAATYLETHGWHQGALYDRRSDASAPPACTVGAIYITGCGRPAGALETVAVGDPSGHIRAALRVLAGYLTEKAGLREPWQIDQFVVYEATIGDWNDEPTRTLTDVTTALREAADEWDRLHPTGGVS
jgi:hypothetical protein